MPMFYVKKFPPKDESSNPKVEIYYDGHFDWITVPLPDDMDTTNLKKVKGEFEYYKSPDNNLSYIIYSDTKKQIALNALFDLAE